MLMHGWSRIGFRLKKKNALKKGGKNSKPQTKREKTPNKKTFIDQAGPVCANIP